MAEHGRIQNDEIKNKKNCRLWRRTFKTCFLSAVPPRYVKQASSALAPHTLRLGNQRIRCTKETKGKETKQSVTPSLRPRVGLPCVSRRPRRQLSYRPSGVDQKVTPFRPRSPPSAPLSSAPTSPTLHGVPALCIFSFFSFLV